MSETFKLWLEYCDITFLLLNFIAEEKNLDWSLHLETFTEMLVYDRVQGHCKYMRWGLVFSHDMYELAEKHPGLYQYFMSGFHTVSRSKTGSTLNCVSTDMALEQVIQCVCVFIYFPKVFIRIGKI